MNARMMAFLVAVLLIIADRAMVAEVTGKVVGVHDGNTNTVLGPGNLQLKVRLEGIDAPELKQPFGNASNQELSRLVFGKQVRIEKKGKDRYGRTLGNIFVGSEWVNHSQVKAGMAWVYLKYSKDPRLLEAESMAKEMNQGIWGDENARPPREWRLASKRKTL